MAVGSVMFDLHRSVGWLVSTAHGFYADPQATADSASRHHAVGRPITEVDRFGASLLSKASSTSWEPPGEACGVQKAPEETINPTKCFVRINHSLTR